MKTKTTEVKVGEHYGFPHSTWGNGTIEEIIPDPDKPDDPLIRMTAHGHSSGHVDPGEKIFVHKSDLRTMRSIQPVSYLNQPGGFIQNFGGKPL